MRPRHFGAVMSAMVTPFDGQGRLDLDAARRLARWLVAHGNDGLVVAATTGEAGTLTDDERCDLVRAVSQAVTVPVVAGMTSNDTAHSVELTRRAKGLGAAGVIAVSPYYSRPPQAGIEAHFRAVAAATELPVMLYDVPLRTGLTPAVVAGAGIKALLAWGSLVALIAIGIVLIVRRRGDAKTPAPEGTGVGQDG